LLSITALCGTEGKDSLKRASLTAEDFYDVMQQLRVAADRLCLGRLVAVMEGGYCCQRVGNDQSHSRVDNSVVTNGNIIEGVGGLYPLRPLRSSMTGSASSSVSSGSAATTTPMHVTSPPPTRRTSLGRKEESLKDCIMATCRALAMESLSDLSSP